LKIDILQSKIENPLEGFALDSSQVEPSVVAHKIKNRIELLINEAGLVTDNRNTHYGGILAVLMVNLGDRDIESAPEPPDKALDDAPFSLQRGHTMGPGSHFAVFLQNGGPMQRQMCCHNTDYHNCTIAAKHPLVKIAP
jgi:hypothetical protein